MGGCCGKEFDDDAGTRAYQNLRGNNGMNMTMTSHHTHEPVDAAARRQQLADAAEKRRDEEARRGVKDVGAVNRAMQRAADREKRQEEAEKIAATQGGPGLKWQVS